MSSQVNIPVDVTVPMIVVFCVKCGIPFAITKDFDAQRRNDDKRFYCPRGHPHRYGNSKDGPVGEESAAKTKPDLETRRAKIKELHELEQAEARLADKAAANTPVQPNVEASDDKPEIGIPAHFNINDDGNRKLYRCKQCDKRYVSAYCAKKHLRFKHGIDIDKEFAARAMEGENPHAQ